MRNRATQVGFSRGWVLLATITALSVLYYAGQHGFGLFARRPLLRSMAPNFSLRDINGNQLSLADYRGKVVLLDFWATWCGFCEQEIPGLVELQRRYRDQGLAVIGVLQDDDPSHVPAFVREYKMNYPVALGDDDRKVARLYACCFGLPTTFVIGRDGRIYAMHEGATPGSYFENEVKQLLAVEGDTELKDFKVGRGVQD